MYDQSLIADGKAVIEMITDHVPKLIEDQFNRPSNVHEKTGPKDVYYTKWQKWNEPVNLSSIA